MLSYDCQWSERKLVQVQYKFGFQLNFFFCGGAFQGLWFMESGRQDLKLAGQSKTAGI